jgi:hypothetical protein
LVDPNVADTASAKNLIKTPAMGFFFVLVSTGRVDAVGTIETVDLPEPVERGLCDLVEDADREVVGLHAQLSALQE